MSRISGRSLFEAIILVTIFHHRLCLGIDDSESDEVPNQQRSRCEQMCSLIIERTIINNIIKDYRGGMLEISTDIPLESPGTECSSFVGAELFSFFKSQSNDDIWKTLNYTMRCALRVKSAEKCKNEQVTELFQYCVLSNKGSWNWTKYNKPEDEDSYYILTRTGQEHHHKSTEPTLWTATTKDSLTGCSSGASHTVQSEMSTVTIQSGAGWSGAQLNKLALALGIGLGFALLIFIVAIIVLCVLLSRERRLKIVQRTHYSTLTPRPTANSDRTASDSAGSAGYETLAPVIGKNPPTTKPSTSKHSPAYEEPATIKPASANNNTKWPKAPSVVYAMVNKLKPNRGGNKRTLASNSDDVIIVDNDLYTVESSPTGENGGFGSNSAENSESRSAYYSAAHPVDEASYAEVPQNGVRY